MNSSRENVHRVLGEGRDGTWSTIQTMAHKMSCISIRKCVSPRNRKIKQGSCCSVY